MNDCPYPPVPPVDATLEQGEFAERADETMYLLRRITLNMAGDSRWLSKQHWLTMPQFLVLNGLRRLGTASNRQLSLAVGLSPATVSVILHRMEARALVARLRNATDRRLVQISLTQAGLDVLSRAMPDLHARIIERFAVLDEQQQVRIVEALRDITRIMSLPGVPRQRSDDASTEILPAPETPDRQSDD